MLEIRNLSSGYSGKTVLQELSVSFPAGSITAIIGPNGCGKSTLLRAITGILPAGGEILLDSQPLTRLSQKEKAARIAFLPQNRPIPEITAGKLVLHGRFPYLGYPRRYRPEDKAAASEALACLGITHLEHRFVPTLSGGERQKVYIAMLLAQQTPVVLMDEPTTYLDISHKFEVMEIARQLADRGKTVALVLHDLDLAMQYADRIVLMQNGRIVSCGTPEDLYSGGLLEEVFGICMEQIHTRDGMQYYFLSGKRRQ